MTSTRIFIFSVITILILGLVASANFKTVEDGNLATVPQTIQIDTMLTTVRDVLALVETDFQTSAIPLVFRYAELDLMVKYASEREAGADLVLINADTSLTENEATILRLRVEPRGSDVSASANDLAKIIIANTKAAIEAAGSDLDVRRVDLTYSIGVKAEASGKVKLSAADLELTSGLTSSSETGNRVRIVFLGD